MKAASSSDAQCPEFSGQLAEVHSILSAVQMIRNPAVFFDELIGEHGDYIHYRGIVEFYVVNHPELVRQVLRDTHRDFDKNSSVYQRFKNAFGEGLVAAEGERWKSARKLMQPVFKGSSIRSFFELMLQTAGEFVEKWNGYKSDDAEFDISAEMDELALQVAGRAFFGQAFEDAADDIRSWTDFINRYCSIPPLNIISNPVVPTPMNIKLRKVLSEYDSFLAGMVRERSQKPPQNDLMGILMTAVHEDSGEVMSGKELSEEIIGMLIGGHETTAKALTWLWYELDRNREVEAALLEEIENVTGGGPLSLEHLQDLKLTDWVIQEAMRLHPPFWFENRNAMQDVELGGVVIPKDSMVVFSRYALHRHSDFWADADKFDPWRFSPERTNEMVSSAYVPFGGGPRICVGRHFSMMEIKVVLVTLLRYYRVRIVDGGYSGMSAKMTMSPKGALRVKVIGMQSN